MSTVEKTRTKVSVAPKSEGNPEGKGSNGFLVDWHQTAPHGVTAKPPQQILAEVFTSMVVLSAAFKYRPAVGVRNYLYWNDGAWTLSLIAPHEWSSGRHATYAGTCELQGDMTWTFAPSERLKGENDVSAAMGRFYDAFAETLTNDSTLDDVLPFYKPGVGYYQRLFGSALRRSVRTAFGLSGQGSSSCQAWNVLLPAAKELLPVYNR